MDTKDTEGKGAETRSGQATGYVAWERIPHAEAESLHGGKLDLRRAYYAKEDRSIVEAMCGASAIVHTLEDMGTVSCSGCYESIEGYAPRGTKYTNEGVPLGCGCRECGYTGLRRERWYWPVPHNK